MKKPILHSLGTFVVLYLLIAFCTTEIDFRKWHELIRWVFGYLFLIAVVYIYIEDKLIK